MIAEVLIYVPSVANFRLNWLNDRLSAAYTAALVFETAPNGMVTDTVARQILDSIRARAVAVKMGQQRRLLAASEVPPAISHVVDMRDMPWHRAIIDAFETLICVDSDVMRVVGPAPMGEFVEIVLDEAPLAQGDGGILDPHPAAVAAHFRDHRRARLPGAARAAGAADAAHDRQHGGVPRRPGESRAHYRGVGPPRRDRHRRARAGRHAAQHRHDAAAEEPSRRARAGGVEDQPRPAQPAVLGAAVLRAAGEDLRSACAALRTQAHALARARHRVLPVDTVLRPRAGAAARPPPDRARAAGRGRARDAGSRSRRRAGALDQRGRARAGGGCRSRTALPHHAQPRAQCAAGAREPRRRAIPAATRSASPAGARARWR